ncbi:MAG: hypothetical protein O2794_04250 [bacterium]|nr:hypothetical protein [bacterium]
MPSQPDKILLRLQIPEREANDLIQNAGIPYVPRDFEAQDEKNKAEAERLGVDFKKFRSEGGSGTPVFGRSGLKTGISIRPMLDELGESGFTTVNYHIEPSQKPSMFYIVIVFSSDSDEEAIGLHERLGDYAYSGWRYAHPWVHAPNESGVVTHALNLLFQMEDEACKIGLHYNSGLWGISDIPR